jgi:ABC-2 type transport system permease protein
MIKGGYFIRLCLADCIKLKRTGFYAIILGSPFVLSLFFLSWFLLTHSPATSLLHNYFLTLTIIFPVILSLAVYIPFGTERKCGKYKELLASPWGRKIGLTSKIVILLIFDFGALLISVFAIKVGLDIGLEYSLLTITHALYLTLIIFAGQLTLLVFHVWISLQFNKGVVIFIGVVEMLLNAILMTDFGNGIWKYIPCSWSVIPQHIFFACIDGAYLPVNEGIRLINTMAGYFGLSALFAYLVVLQLFSKHE